MRRLGGGFSVSHSNRWHVLCKSAVVFSMLFYVNHRSDLQCSRSGIHIEKQGASGTDFYTIKGGKVVSPGGTQSKTFLELHKNFLSLLKQLIFSCDQAALTSLLSVRLSVCDTFFTMFLLSYPHGIFRSYFHWQKWCPCKRSRSEVKGPGHRGQNPT